MPSHQASFVPGQPYTPPITRGPAAYPPAAAPGPPALANAVLPVVITLASMTCLLQGYQNNQLGSLHNNSLLLKDGVQLAITGGLLALLSVFLIYRRLNK